MNEERCNFSELRFFYKNALFQDVISFGIRHSLDQEYGSIFDYMDAGKPPFQLEWDQKLWGHLETLVALLMTYVLTEWQVCWL